MGNKSIYYTFVRFLIAAVGLAALPASAHHLGPAVIGQARTEETTICRTEEAAVRWLNGETAYLRRNEANLDMNDYVEFILSVFDSEQCALLPMEITYTPKRKVAEGLSLTITAGDASMISNNEIYESEVQTANGIVTIWVGVDTTR